MRNSIRGNKIMFIFKKRITQIFFLIPALVLGLAMSSASYADKLDAALAKASYGPVTGSDTLGKIVSRHYSGSSLTKQQIMTAILRANPEAFIGGNIHFLLRGATLLLPKERLIATINQNDAKKIIKEHYRYFQRGKTGNFEIAPLVDSSSRSDTRDFETDAAFILSEQADRINIPDTEKNQTSPAPQIETPIAEIIVKKDPIKENNTTQNNTVQAKKLAGKVDNSVNDIELESLKIKISRLEKLLSARGISSSISDGTAKELKDTLENQKKKINQLEEDKENKNNELAQLKEKISELEVSLNKMSQSLSDKDSLALSTGDDEKTIISQLKIENADLEKKLGSLQVELKKKTEEMALLKTKINDSKQTINNLESKLLDSDKENTKLDQQIAEIEAKLAEIKQEPARNLSLNGSNNDTLGFVKSPWTWLLPTLFLLSVLAYLFKRSFSQAKKVPITHSDTVEKDTKNISPPNANKKLMENKTSKAITTSVVPDIISSASEEESMESSIKLDIAKAYMDMDMPDAAIEILQEAHQEGSNKQRLEAKHLLEKLA